MSNASVDPCSGGLARTSSLNRGKKVDQCAKQTLENILRDMHLIKTMRCIEFGPVLQVPENRPCFPYLQQRLRFFHLSRRGVLFPVFQQLINFGAAPLTWRSSMLSLTIE